MNAILQDVLTQIPKLSLEERLELIKVLTDSVALEDAGRDHSILELAGLGAEIWQGIDAQEYVTQLRREWDEPR